MRPKYGILDVAMNWEQLQTFHALLVQGSITKAAKVLSVHPTTITRRIAELEKFVGARLLKRKNNAYMPTMDGDKVLKIAGNMAEQARHFQQLQQGLNNEVSGTVRITTIESFIINCLLPHMPALRKKYPGLNLEFISSDLNLSFSRRETDLAIRFTKPNLMNIVSRKLGDVGFALYGNDNSNIDCTNLIDKEVDWVCYDDEFLFLPEAKWLLKNMRKTEPVIKSSNAGVLKRAIQVGLGVGVLPCYRGDSETELSRVSGPEPVVFREAWLLMHDDYRSNVRTRTVVNWIKEIFKLDSKLISGRSS